MASGSFLNDLFGSRPDVPRFNPINIANEQMAAIQQNQNALPGAETLAGSVNTFNQDQLTKMLTANFPDLAGVNKAASGNILSMLQGNIPADVSDAIQRNAAARSLGGGFAGGGMQRDLVARDLGLTSLQLTNQGLSAAEGWMQTVKSSMTPGQFDVSSMFFTPQQRLAFNTSERNSKFNRDWMQEQIDAMPDPMTVGLTKMIMGGISSGMSAAGGGGGGGGSM